MADDMAVNRLMSIVVVLGVLLPAIAVLYAETKKVHWPGEEASMYMRSWLRGGWRR